MGPVVLFQRREEASASPAVPFGKAMSHIRFFLSPPVPGGRLIQRITTPPRHVVCCCGRLVGLVRVGVYAFIGKDHDCFLFPLTCCDLKTPPCSPDWRCNFDVSDGEVYRFFPLARSPQDISGESESLNAIMQSLCCHFTSFVCCHGGQGDSLARDGCTQHQPIKNAPMMFSHSVLCLYSTQQVSV